MLARILELQDTWSSMPSTMILTCEYPSSQSKFSYFSLEESNSEDSFMLTPRTCRFLTKYAPFAVSQNFTYELINGGLSTQNDFVDDDFEANLDMQYAAALGYKQNITYYSTGGRV